MSGNNRNVARNFLAREMGPIPKSSVLDRCRDFMPLIAAANEELKRKSEDGIANSLTGISIVPIAKKSKDEQKEIATKEDSSSSSDSSDSEVEDSNAVEFEIDVRANSDSESEADNDNEVPEAFKKPIESNKKQNKSLIEEVDD
ncbi:unnamed protein product [Bursaphelenchus okinawaensis]|uniref:Uncharacterized protein n=1 Tax=Bursaphelenchus okinawaensis TaxID=465554 RepID=A0A811KTQ2_9BILA|nr:unnamed protein product [Bursaphelenchus okinawaensis]CAG9111891.1 unnamed protein product [Bursaphelenchus okinawaensis]